MSQTSKETAFELVLARIDEKINKLQLARRVVVDRIAEIRVGREIPNADIADLTIDELLDEPTDSFTLVEEAK